LAGRAARTASRADASDRSVKFDCKQFRRVTPRYDKLLANFMGFVTLAPIAILLR
jgi:transposase